jgi:hypothetical protein
MIDGLGRDGEAMNSRGMEQDHPQVAKLHAERYGASTFLGASFSKAHKQHAIEIAKTNTAQFTVEFFQAIGLAAEGSPPDLAQVAQVQVDKITNCFRAAFHAKVQGLSPVNPLLDLTGPNLGIRSQAKGPRGILAIASDLRSPLSRSQF